MISLVPVILFACVIPCEMKIGLKRDKLNEYLHEINSETTQQMMQKLNTLSGYSKSQPLIILDSVDEFSEFIIQTPRNYSTILIFNDLQKKNQRKCPSCVLAHVHFEYIAKSHFKFQAFSPNRHHHYIFFVEILKHKMNSVFERMLITKVPTIYYVPPEGKLSNLQQLDVKQYSLQDVNKIAKWIEITAGIKVKLPTKDNSFSFNMLVFWVGVLIALICYMHHKNLDWDIVREKISQDILPYFGISLAIILVSGHVYNMIQESTFSIPTAEGEMFIYRARRIQLQAEAFIVSFIYLGFGVGFIFLIEGRRFYMSKLDKQRGNLFSLIGLIATSFSYFALQNVYYKKMS